jgi:hypothetical protein
MVARWRGSDQRAPRHLDDDPAFAEADEMKRISDAELYEFYVDTLSRCSQRLRALTDEELIYNLSEEFDIGAITFLHANTLSRLREAGYLDDELVRQSGDLRARWMALMQQQPTLEQLKSSAELDALFDLSDSIRSRLTPPHDPRDRPVN